MNSPLYDDKGVRQSSVQRDHYKFASQTAEAAKQNAEAAKQTAKNTLISNNELRKLNQTSEAIAAANAALVALQTQAVNEAGKQTALLDAQLQISKINDLEKNRQNQLKQAAFSIDQKIKKITLESNVLARFFLLRDEYQQVGLVGLTADAPNEIADKQYVSEVLNSLDKAMSDAKSSLSELQVEDVEKYYAYSDELAEANGLVTYYKDSLSGFSLPEKQKKIAVFLMGIFFPKFIAKKENNNVAIVAYWISLYYTWGLSLIIGVGLYSVAAKKADKERSDTMAVYESLKLNLSQAEKTVRSYEEFFAYFKNAYALP
jgi:hypothetical protein